MKLKTYLKSAVAGFTALAMAAAMFPTSGFDHVQAASTDGNMILHWDMTLNADGSLKDITDNGHDGVLVSPVENGKIDNIDILDLKGGYADIPDGTIGSDMTEVTINMLVNITQNVKSSWMFCLGSSNTKYLYFTACSNQNECLRGGVGYGSPGYNHEADIGGNSSLEANKWQNITVTYKDNGKFSFYKNGVLQAETNAIVADKTGNYTLQDLMTAGDDRDGYMGWSFYGGKDPKFQGKVADFRIYDKAMSQEEVTELQTDINAMLNNLAENDFSASDIDLTEEDCLGENSSKNSITKNLVLPTKTTLNGSPEKEAAITKWVSSDPQVIAEDGTVTRADTDKTVTLTATVTRNNVSANKELTFKVPLLISDEDAVKLDKEALIIPNTDDIRGNVCLPASGAKGSVITWTSSNENVISTQAQDTVLPGAVTRPVSQDASVKLTATITSNAVTETKEFNCTVRKAYTMPETTDYLFAYFPYANIKDERIYFGISQDGLNFSALNDGKFILESTLGTHGLRDPFIIRSPEGDRFYLIATDLTVAGLDQNGTHYPGQNWDQNQTHGSQKIMVWESTDLINWSEQRECKVAADDAGCTWAPEAYWDDSTGQYVVFWASKTSVDNYGKQRVFYATTRDFYTFSEAQVWIEAPGSVIDTTVIKAGEYYYRYTKNEDGNTINGTPSKRVYCERSKSLTSANWERVHNNSLAYSKGQIEGACIFKLNKDDVENAKNIAKLKDINLTGEDIFCLIADATGVTIFPGLSDDITTGSFHILGEQKVETVNGTTLYTMPEPAASHGTIMPITTEEYNNLKLQDDIRKKAKEAAEEITLETTVTSDLSLPTTAANGAQITWASSDENLISNTGTVSRPKDGDKEVTLTAAITAQGTAVIPDVVVEKAFTLTVKKVSLSAEELNAIADAAVNELTLPTTVTSNITLPDVTSNGAQVAWKTSNESIISATGVVTRPANEDAKVTLTATITVKGNEIADDVIKTKSFDITVTKQETTQQPVAEHTVTFDSKGGSKVNSVTVKDGETVAEPKTTRKKYIFAGWYNGSQKYNFSNPVTGNLTLTAKWTKVTVGTPKTPALKNTKGKLTITVKKVQGAAGYQFTYSTDKKFKKGKTTTKTTTKNTLTIKKPKKGKTYYVKVKAYKKDSVKSNVFGKFSKVKKLKIKK